MFPVPQILQSAVVEKEEEINGGKSMEKLQILFAQIHFINRFEPLSSEMSLEGENSK